MILKKARYYTLAICMTMCFSNMASAEETFKVFNGEKWVEVLNERSKIDSKKTERAARSVEPQAKYGVLVAIQGLTQDERVQLELSGIKIKGVQGRDKQSIHYLVYLDGTVNNLKYDALQASSNVVNLISLSPKKRLAKRRLKTSDPDELGKYIIYFHSETSKNDIKSILSSAHAKILENNGYEFLVELEDAVIRDLLTLSEVASVEEYEVPRALNDESRELTSVDEAQQNINFSDPEYLPSELWLKGQKYTGDGVVVGVYDTGIDLNNPDFREAVLDSGGNPISDKDDVSGSGYKTVSRQVSDCGNGSILTVCNTFYDFDLSRSDRQHGSHVAGIVGGNGWLSAWQNLAHPELGNQRGVAPKVTFWSYRINGSSLKNREIGHVTNHSHTSADTYSWSVGQADRVLKDQNFDDRRRKTTIFASANDQQKFGYYSILGNVAKNILMVGSVSKNNGELSDFSSIGPAPDGRIKPDVMAPGSGNNDLAKGPTQPLKISIDYFRLLHANSTTPYFFEEFNGSVNPWDGWRDMRNLKTENGSMSFDAIGKDPYILSDKTAAAVTGQLDDRLQIRYKIELDPEHRSVQEIHGMLRWAASDGDALNSVDIKWSSDGQWHVIDVPMKSLLGNGEVLWDDAEQVGYVRLDIDKADLGGLEDGVLSVHSGRLTSGPGEGTYGYSNGTSMAAPHVAGIVALLVEKYSELFLGCVIGEACPQKDSNGLRSSGSKALLIHTATDHVNADEPFLPVNYDITNTMANGNTYYTQSFVGPDFATGWGVVHAEKALTYTTPETYSEHEFKVGDGKQVFRFTVSDASKALRVTAVWDDEPSMNTSTSTEMHPKLVNDIDAYLLDPHGNRHYPWRIDTPLDHSTLSSFSMRDNDPIRIEDVKPAYRECEHEDVHYDCFDHLNNVEVIDVDSENVTPGNWMLVVGPDTAGLATDQIVSFVSDYPLSDAQPFDRSVDFSVNGLTDYTIEVSAAGPIYLKGESGHANQFFVSVWETNEGGGMISSETMRWLSSEDNTKVLEGTFDLRAFCVINDCGFDRDSHYKVKLATGNGWKEKTRRLYFPRARVNFFTINGQSTNPVEVDTTNPILIHAEASHTQTFSISFWESNQWWITTGSRIDALLSDEDNQKVLNGTFDLRDYCVDNGCDLRNNSYARIDLWATANNYGWRNEALLIHINDNNLVIDHFSDQDIGSWTMSSVGGTASVVDSQACGFRNGFVGARWKAQFGRGGIFLDEGQSYRVTFDARSNTDIATAVKLGMDMPPWTAHFDESIQLTPTMRSYEYTFTKQGAHRGAGFKIFLGAHPNVEVCIDNFRVEVLP